MSKTMASPDLFPGNDPGPKYHRNVSHSLPWVVATAGQLLASGMPAEQIPAAMGMQRETIGKAFGRWGAPQMRRAFWARPNGLAQNEVKVIARTFVDSLPKDDAGIRKARREALDLNPTLPVHGVEARGRMVRRGGIVRWVA